MIEEVLSPEPSVMNINLISAEGYFSERQFVIFSSIMSSSLYAVTTSVTGTYILLYITGGDIRFFTDTRI